MGKAPGAWLRLSAAGHRRAELGAACFWRGRAGCHRAARVARPPAGSHDSTGAEPRCFGSSRSLFRHDKAADEQADAAGLVPCVFFFFVVVLVF